MDQSDTAPRAITVDEAMAIALNCLKHGQVRDAEALCLKVLEVAPGHPDALHYAGVLAHRNGRTDEAIVLIEGSLALDPDQPDWHSNLGIVLQAKGDLDGAVREFERAIALQPGHANAHNNLGVLLRVDGRHEDAERAYRTAIELNPGHADAYHNLAILLDLTGRTPEAVTAYCRALTLKPEYPEARRLLALAYSALGDRDKAMRVCEEWVKDEPDDPVARHALASVSGQDVPVRAADDYVRKVFDSFAASFEAKLARLHYRAPDLVVAALAEAAGTKPARALDVLDIGCGTGLCGPMLAPYARRLIGVDLSGGMLDHAREKTVYDELVQAELTAYLEGFEQAFDVIVSADTLVYFGALDQVVAAAARALRPAGALVFTLEELVGPDATAPFCIQPHGRYNHRAEYVERLLSDVGLHPTIARAELRKEQGLPVAGLVVRAAKPVRADGAAEAGATGARVSGAQHAQ
jgi:predicted TPR repeat methyltransferase